MREKRKLFMLDAADFAVDVHYVALELEDNHFARLKYNKFFMQTKPSGIFDTEKIIRDTKKFN